MYTLRIVSDNGVQTNQALGQHYTLVHRFASSESFRGTFKDVFGMLHSADSTDQDSINCYAFLRSEGGAITIPLYMDERYYIMTESGKTFANLSYRK